MSARPNLAVGQKWLGSLGGREVRWTVTWVGTKKARLTAEVEFGWATATVWIDRMLEGHWRPVPNEADLPTIEEVQGVFAAARTERRQG